MEEAWLLQFAERSREGVRTRLAERLQGGPGVSWQEFNPGFNAPGYPAAEKIRT
jgi:hypothetical protein